MGDGANAPAACIFCEIVAHRSPAYVLYEDEATVAFLDLFPFTRGHLLVVPKRHGARLSDLPAADGGALFRTLAQLCRRVERLAPDYNVALNAGAAAGQIVFHVHFHVIPRYGEANPFRAASRTRLDDDDARSLVAELGRA
ncbi:MAG TPA: HIT domain-containing protein [Thermoplasmata archaeon]|nr:HIT domain-containing protein [Thermoplasmata archaeon]